MLLILLGKRRVAALDIQLLIQGAENFNVIIYLELVIEKITG